LAEDPGEGIRGLGESQIPKRSVAGAMIVVNEAEANSSDPRRFQREAEIGMAILAIMMRLAPGH
jgi:hypothetical protein